MFGVDVIFACGNQALGILDMRAEAAEDHESEPITGRARACQTFMAERSAATVERYCVGRPGLPPPSSEVS